MEKKQIEAVIQTLENVQQRPLMFIMTGKNPVVSWMIGFNTALRALMPQKEDNFYKEAVTECGWEWSTTAPLGEMEKRKLSEQEIIDEFLAISVETWKKRLAAFDQNNINSRG